MMITSQMCRLRRFAALLVGVCCVATSVCLAQSSAQIPTLRLEGVEARLQLTPEQRTQIEPLIQRHNDRMAEIRANLGRAHSSGGKRALLLEAASIQQDLNDTLKPLLTDEQRVEWHKIRGEMREKLKGSWR